MNLLEYLQEMFVRLRYPLSLPRDLGIALGIEVTNSLRFGKMLDTLLSPACQPRRLFKYMPRKLAEEAFDGAVKKERFLHSTLCSFSFNEGWLEFELQFDEESRLRRLYLHHKRIPHPRGHELALGQADFESCPFASSAIMLSADPARNQAI